jgi:hypothetical protein
MDVIQGLAVGKMRRRNLIQRNWRHGAGAWPLAGASAKTPVIIGLLHNSSLESVRDSIPAFHQDIGQLSGEAMR